MPLIGADYRAFATEVDASIQWDWLLAKIAGAPPNPRDVIEPIDSSRPVDDDLTAEEQREVLRGLARLRAVESTLEMPDIGRSLAEVVLLSRTYVLGICLGEVGVRVWVEQILERVRVGVGGLLE